MADEHESKKSESTKLLRVRLSFPDIWKPKAIKEDDVPKYAAAFLLDKKDHEELIGQIKGAIWGLAIEAFGGKEKARALLDKKKLHVCLHEGSEKDYDGYGEHNLYLTASSVRRPHVIDRDKSPLSEDDRKVYAGCYVNAAVRLWVQNNEWGKRINAELLAVQFVADGEPFGAPPFNVEEEFEDLDAGKKKPGKAEEPPFGGSAAEPPDDDEIPF
jgi:Protein of unknown function (DUF2815)